MYFVRLHEAVKAMRGLSYVLLMIYLVLCGSTAFSQSYNRDLIPQYQVDPYWPKPLPADWLLGEVVGVAVDKKDHIWIVQRPLSLTDYERGAAFTPKLSKCCVPAPPIMEFDKSGNFIQGWGGPGEGYDWPLVPHGIDIDAFGNVWVGGVSPNGLDNMLLKFSSEGKFLLQIGKPTKSLGSNSKTQLGGPAHSAVDPVAHELYVADGYHNKRIIVFDSETGEYKRHWGAYGNVPSDELMPPNNPNSPQFSTPVHCIHLMNDNTVYVCDRENNRIQIFEKNGKYIRQILTTDMQGIDSSAAQIPKDATGQAMYPSRGTAWDLVTAGNHDEFLLVTDGKDNQVIVIERGSGRIIATFGRGGRYAGQFIYLHSIASDSDGNIYTTEGHFGKRIQKFTVRN
jgi:DNA-binding beta-propeller fold protein YncE